MYGSTAAPPPTPSPESLKDLSSSSADALTALLHNLPATHLSLPSRRRTPRATAAAASGAEPPPTLSFSDENLSSSLSDLLLSPSNLGFFQLTHHPVPPQLARSAESDSLSLFDLSQDQKESYFPATNWPLGFYGGGEGDAFCLDGSCSSLAESTESPLPVTSLREFVSGMEKLGLKIVDLVSRAAGFDNPVGEDPTRFRTLATVVERSSADEKAGRKYPFIVRLQYQLRTQKYSVLTDSGPITCESPHVDSVLVSFGDILQVWSNGKLKKVRGCWPLLNISSDNKSRYVSITVELTLPTNTMVSPLFPAGDGDDDEDEQVMMNSKLKFKPFLFDEIYAWKVYHSGILFKDPLDKYRIQ